MISPLQPSLEEEFVRTNTKIMDSRWFDSYLKVKQFIETNGHDKISFYDEEWKEIATWLSTQRSLHHRQKLKPEREALLKGLSIRLTLVERWDKQEKAWEDRFNELIEYQQTYGHLNVPSTTKTHKSLAVWLMNQRALYKRGELQTKRQKQLEEIGVCFILREYKHRPSKGYGWADYIRMFKRLKEESGHVLISTHLTIDGLPIGNWIQNTRNLQTRGELPEIHKKELDHLGFAWRAAPVCWEYKYQELVSFYEREGHIDVPKTYVEKNYPYSGQALQMPLGNWLEKQRRLYRDGQLEESKIKRIEALPIDWRVKGERTYTLCWEKQFTRLSQLENVNFYTLNPEDPNYSLSKWAKNQRSRYFQNALSQDRITRLESIGFIWDLRQTYCDKRWQSCLEKWKLIWDSHGLKTREILKAEDEFLFRWAETQRFAFRNQTLKEERKKQLIVAGFEQYARLLRTTFKEEGF